MFNRLWLLLAGLAMTASATGCCCLGGCFGGNRCCNPCYYSPTSPCGPGGCAPTYGYPSGPTGYVGSDVTAFAPTTTVTTSPVVTTTVMSPTLPTY